MSDDLVARLRAVGCVFAEEEAAEIRRLGGDPERIVTARAAGVPLEHALGVARFAGLDIPVTDGVFIPRRRAEALVEAAVAARPDACIVVDLGCGSGAIAAALATRLPGAEVHACDIDEQALALARDLGARQGFAVHAGDWWDALPRQLAGRVDLAVAYLPHVPTQRLGDIPDDFRRHEPERSVAGGPDGLDPLRAVLRPLDTWLAPGGLLVTLIAPEQREAAQTLLPSQGVEFVIA